MIYDLVLFISAHKFLLETMFFEHVGAESTHLDYCSYGVTLLVLWELEAPTAMFIDIDHVNAHIDGSRTGICWTSLENTA